LCIVSILFTLLCSGCVDDIDNEIFKEKLVVVNCILTRDSAQHLSLTYSSELGNTIYEEIEDAAVLLYEEDSLVGTFCKSVYSEWELKYKPKYGRIYRLEVKIDGKETICAETQFPFGLDVLRDYDKDEEGRYAFDVNSNNPYWIFCFDKGRDTIMYPPIIEDRFSFISAIGTDNPYADDFNKLNYDDYYSGKHNKYIRMNPSESRQSIKLYDLYSCLVIFRSVSDDYDKYLKSSLSKMMIFESFDDPTQWLDETAVYNNIINGVGIFGAYDDIIINCNVAL